MPIPGMSGARAAADIDEDARRLQQAFVHPDDIRALEPGMPLTTVRPSMPAQPRFDIRAGVG